MERPGSVHCGIRVFGQSSRGIFSGNGIYTGTDQCSSVARAAKSQTGADRTKPGCIRAWKKYVAGIAAGNGRGSVGGIYMGVAPQSELLIVKLGNPRQGGFPRTTELMQGVDYVLRKSLEYRMPVAINISFGNTYGSHEGTSLLERYLDDMANYWKSVICVGSGNEGTAAEIHPVY